MKVALIPDPEFGNLASWQAYLTELRALPEDTIGREAGIKDSEHMIGLLREYAKNDEHERAPAQGF